MNRAQLKMYVIGIAGRMLKWSTIRGQESRYGYLRASLPPADPVLGEEEHDQPVRLMQHFGFRSQPPNGSECVVAAMRGSAQNAVVIASENLGLGPTDLASGETVIFSKADGTTIKLDANGKITIDAAAGQDVVVNGGSLKVARDTEKVKPTATMQTLLTKVIALLNAAVPGSITPAEAAALALQIGNVDGGADHFKG